MVKRKPKTRVLRRIALYEWALMLAVPTLLLFLTWNGAHRTRGFYEETRDPYSFAPAQQAHPTLLHAAQPWSPKAALPKVALMVLTRGYLRTEPIWGQFLSAAAAIAQPGKFSNDKLATHSPLPDGWQQLFSLYVHPRPNFTFPSRSIFSGREVPGRVLVEWAQSSMISAQRALLRAALADPLNQRFVLLSDTCIPLYPPATVYWQLLSEQRSRINACERHRERWQAAMVAFGLRQQQWRKSSQWSTLTRAHAEAVMRDERVVAAFHQHCQGILEPDGKLGPRFCIADEHYVPTLLAHLGLERECDCGAVSTYTAWEWPSSHPKAFTEASLEVLEEMRGKECKALWTWGAAAKAGIQAAVQHVQQQQPAALPAAALNSSSTAQAVAQGLEALSKAFAALGVTTLPSRCPMFGRKIPARRAFQWARLMQPILTE